jgi:hypothetical protein
MTGSPLRLGFIGGGLNHTMGSSSYIASHFDGILFLVAGCILHDTIKIKESIAMR